MVKLILAEAQGRTVVLAAAPPCSTMTFVRSRNRLTRCRDNEHLDGLPGRSPDTAAKVADANALAEVAAIIAMRIVDAGGHASTENPAGSYLWKRLTY